MRNRRPLDPLAAAVLAALTLVACKTEEPQLAEATTMEAETEPVGTEMGTGEAMGTDDGGSGFDPMGTEDPPPGGVGAEVPAPAPAAAPPLMFYNDAAGLDGKALRSHGLAEPTEAEQIKTCQTECTNARECEGWTVIRRNSYGTNPPSCYIMSKATRWMPSPCCVSGVKAGLPPPG
jgi:hypothetical protein